MLCFPACPLVVYSLLSVAICTPKEKIFSSIAIGFPMGIVSELG